LEALAGRAAEATLDAERQSGPDRVTVLLTGDDALREMNQRFNCLDEVTDVLSFNAAVGWHDGAKPAGPDAFPGEDESRLGDIAISAPQVERQAAAAGVPVERELAMLAIHGVLHLLGYDHASPEEERVMFGKTDVILNRVMAGVAGQTPHPVPLLQGERRLKARARR
jgi:probable rRNA maturation factor